MSGTGTQPATTFSAGSLSFAGQLVGTTSGAMSVTLTNSGTATLNIPSLALTGANAGDFAQTNTCGASLGAGASGTINVTFTPTATGMRRRSHHGHGRRAGQSSEREREGTGTQPATTFSAGSLSFAGQLVGTTSGAMT